MQDHFERPTLEQRAFRSSSNRVLKKANRAFFNTTLIYAIAQKTEGFRAIAEQVVEKHRVFQQPSDMK